MRMYLWRTTLPLVALYAQTALCDTEIINFSTSERDFLGIHLPWASQTHALRLSELEHMTITAAPSSWQRSVSEVCEDVTEGHNDGTGSPGACLHELWFALPSRPYGPKTLRLSWPASFPAEFSIQAFSVPELHALIRSQSYWRTTPESDIRQHPSEANIVTYARVLAKSRGVLASTSPSSTFLSPLSPSPSNRSKAEPLQVPLTVMYEPLLLGVLPSSLLPTVGLLVVIALLSAVFVRPVVIGALEDLAAPLRVNAETGRGKKGRSD